MKQFTLQRISDDGLATLGIMFDESGQEICKTLERPWLGNQHDVSCIPGGAYPGHRAIHHPASPHAYEVFRLDGVPFRDDIDIHIGNTVKDTEGCILLGLVKGDAPDSIAESKDAFVKFMGLLAGEQNFMLVVKPSPEVA